jgi:hypothetical protein
MEININVKFKKNNSYYFLLPLTGIKNTNNIEDTYIQLEGAYKPIDYVLVVKYNNVSVKTKRDIYACKRLIKEYDKNTYIFDLSEYRFSIYKYYKGHYSFIDDSIKKKILYFWSGSKIGNKLKEWFYPKDSIKRYAEYFDVSIDDFKGVKQLGEKPVMEKEVLIK